MTRLSLAVAAVSLTFAANPTDHLGTDARIARFEHALQSDAASPATRIGLARAFLAKLRETGDPAYLAKAEKLVPTLPADRPAARVRLEIDMNLHRFPQVAERAGRLLSDDPSDPLVLGLLGDALMEMGRYDAAHDAYRRMASLGGNLFSYNRLAWYEFVTGNPEAALGWMAQAVAAGSPSPENEAWCLSEMGDMLFKTGRLADAAYAQRQALLKFPNYHRALAGLGRALAASGNTAEAIDSLKKAQALIPLPDYAASLEALYQKLGDLPSARRQQALLDTLAKLSAANGEKANRTIALAYADQDRNLADALRLGTAEFDVRSDVYTHDTMSWILYKSGRLDEARESSSRALALNTPEPAFYFHAGMIAGASGDQPRARRMFARALALNPEFDPRSAPLARRLLD